MLTLRTHIMISAGIMAAIVVLAMIGNALHDSGVVQDSPTIRLNAMILFLGLTAMILFSG